MSVSLLHRQVAYWDLDEDLNVVERTATVVASHDHQEVDLCVFTSNGLFFRQFVGYSPTANQGYWSWPAHKRQALQAVTA